MASAKSDGASAFKKVPLGASDNLQGDVMTQLEIPPSLVNKLVKGEPIIRRVPPAECSPQQVTTGSTFTTTGHKSLPPPPYTSSPNDPYADIHILHNEIPPEHRAGYFDFVFSFAEADEEMARNVIQIFKDHVRYGANEPPQICVINRRDEFSWIQSQFKSAQEAMERSTYMVIILTKNYIEDKWSVMVQEAMLWETLISLEKQWCIIPLFLTRKSELDFKIPFGLGPLKGIELPRMFSPPAASIGDIDFGNIHKENLDRYFLKNMAMMLNNKVRIRREKEKEGQRKKDRWLKEEKRRRWKKREQEKIMQEKELEDDWKRDAEAQRQVNQLRQEPSHAPPTYTEVSKENRLPQERDIQSLQASRQIHFHLPNGYSGPLPDMKTVFNVQEVHHGAFGDNAQVMVQNSLVEANKDSEPYVVEEAHADPAPPASMPYPFQSAQPSSVSAFSSSIQESSPPVQATSSTEPSLDVQEIPSGKISSSVNVPSFQSEELRSHPKPLPQDEASMLGTATTPSIHYTVDAGEHGLQNSPSPPSDAQHQEVRSGMHVDAHSTGREKSCLIM